MKNKCLWLHDWTCVKSWGPPGGVEDVRGSQCKRCGKRKLKTFGYVRTEPMQNALDWLNAPVINLDHSDIMDKFLNPNQRTRPLEVNLDNKTEAFKIDGLEHS